MQFQRTDFLTEEFMSPVGKRPNGMYVSEMTADFEILPKTNFSNFLTEEYRFIYVCM